MKRIQFHQYGGPDVMKLEAFDLPAPVRDQVLVKVKTAAINPLDWKVRRGDLKMMTGRAFPRAMGVDFAGVVQAVGPDVRSFKPGDEVFGQSNVKASGALAEALLTQPAGLAHKPAGLSFEQAACLPGPALTALIGLYDKAGLKAGQRVFINGCAGGVGEAAVQLALLRGASVAGSCSARSMARARALGVQPVVDYAQTRVADLTDRFDVVYDTAGTLTTAQGLGLLKPGGALLDLHFTPLKALRALVDKRLKLVFCAPRDGALDEIARAAVASKLTMTVGKAVPLSGAIELITAIERGQKIDGKGLVLMP